MQLAPERVIKPMLAKDGDLSKIKYPVVVQPKLDGIRCLVVDGVARSRTFKLIPNAEIQSVLGRPEFEGLDGEIIVGSPTAEGCMQATTSFVMAPNKRSIGLALGWGFYVFDRWDRPDQSYERRMYGVGALCASHGMLEEVECHEVDDAAALEALEAEFLAEGHEGIIVRDPSALYKHGRSGTKGPLLKVKRFIDFEAVITGVYEEMHNANEATKDAFGRTERSTVKANKHGKNTLGGFELRAINGPHEGDEFRCGTGFKREQRKGLWDEFCAFGTVSPELLGRIVKIKSFPIGVKDLPRFPVFLGFRDMEIDG